jgi:hypothetical protein
VAKSKQQSREDNPVTGVEIMMPDQKLDDKRGKRVVGGEQRKKREL